MGTTATCCTGGCEGSGTAFMFDMEANQPPRKSQHLHPHQNYGVTSAARLQSLDQSYHQNPQGVGGAPNLQGSPSANVMDPLGASHDTINLHPQLMRQSQQRYMPTSIMVMNDRSASPTYRGGALTSGGYAGAQPRVAQSQVWSRPGLGGPDGGVDNLTFSNKEVVPVDGRPVSVGFTGQPTSSNAFRSQSHMVLSMSQDQNSSHREQPQQLHVDARGHTSGVLQGSGSSIDQLSPQTDIQQDASSEVTGGPSSSTSGNNNNTSNDDRTRRLQQQFSNTNNVYEIQEVSAEALLAEEVKSPVQADGETLKQRVTAQN